MALTTLAAVKTHLSIASADTSQDALLTQLLAGADAAIKQYFNQDLETTTRTEFMVGTGTPKLVLRQRPVQSITSLYLDSSAYYGEASGAFPASTLLVAGRDYCLQRDANSTSEKSMSGIVVKIGGVWTGANEKIRGLLTQGIVAGVGNIKVTYISGYVTIPADLVLACHQMVSILRQGAQQGGPLQQESLDYYSYQLAAATPDSSPMGSVKQLLSGYKPWDW